MNKYVNVQYARQSAKRKKKSSFRFFFAAVICVVAVLVGVVVVGVMNKETDNPDYDIIRAADFEMTKKDTTDAEIITPDIGTGEGIHTVKFSFYGNKDIVCLTNDTTVGDLMDKAGIKLGENNKLRSSLENPITEDTAITVDELGEASLEIWDEIPYETKYVYVQTIPRGSYQLVQSGVKGIKYELYNRQLVNGEEVSRELVYETVYRYPQNEIYYVGSGGTIYKGGETLSYSYYIDMRATYYTRASCPTEWGYMTISGRPVDEYCVAVKFDVIPMNTWVYVENPATAWDSRAVDYGKRITADTGGGIYDSYGNLIKNWIDIYIEDDSRVDAYFKWYGIIDVRVYILD